MPADEVRRRTGTTLTVSRRSPDIASATPPLHRPHGFDVLRLAAASLVLISHSYLIPTGTEPDLLSYGDRGFSLGRLGVFVFFIVSGYLVCGSWLHRPELRTFADKRFRRIYPALCLMVALTALVLGPLVSTSDRYFLELETWSFVVRNLLVVPYQHTLPGVFDGGLVNGVMWTLGLEVLAYVMIAALGSMGLLRPRILLTFAVAFSLAGWAWIYEAGPPIATPIGIRLGLFGFFMAGAWLRASGHSLTGYHAALGLCLLVLPVLSDLPLSILAVPGLTVLIIYAGTRTAAWARPVVRLGDPSYGAYIYGYVFQQLFLLTALQHAPRPVFILASLVVGLGVGYLSWHLWEHRFLNSRRAALTA